MDAITGHSDDPTTSDAIDAVIAQIEAGLGDAEPKAALLFCSVDYEHGVILSAIQERWPGLPLVGGTSDGEISDREGFCDDSILLTVLSGEGLRVHAGVGHRLSEDVGAAVTEALDGLDLKDPGICLTTLAPTTDTVKVIEAISEQLGDMSCPVVGGLTGDHREFTHMLEFYGGESSQDSLPLLFIEGDFEASWGAASGWTGSGKKMTVTQSDGHVVHTIDHQPALLAFKQHFGALPPTFLGQFPLLVHGEEGATYLRACLDSDQEAGTLSFGGSVEQGATVQFTEVLEEGLLQGSVDSLAQAFDRFAGSSPQVALIFSCAARKWVLGMEVPKEIELLRALSAERGVPDLAISGLYCFGEIAPNGHAAKNGFHNETCVSVILGR